MGVAVPGRRLASGEVGLARRLAHHAALAVASARLYREACAAISARDALISIVAHELNNPLSSLDFALQGAALGQQKGRPAERVATKLDGLGLWIVRQIVEAIGGTIHVESATQC